MKSLRLAYFKSSVPLLCIAMTVLFSCQTKVDNEDKTKNVKIKQGNNSSSEFEKHFQEGNEYSKNGQFLEAIKSYHNAIELNTNAPSIHYNLANTYIAIDKVDDAIQEYKLAIEYNPLLPDYHRNLGFAYALKKNEDMAKSKYEELKKMDPSKAEELLQWINKAQEPL